MTDTLLNKDPYHAEYDGFYVMKSFDAEENALTRWFNNFKQERYAVFASEYEWLVVKEAPATAKNIKRRYVCEIGDDGRGTKRFVAMDYTAPPAPMLTFAAKRLYVPPPLKSAEEMRKELEWDRMHRRGYKPIRKPVRRKSNSLLVMDWGVSLEPTDRLEYEIEWVYMPTATFGFDLGRELEMDMKMDLKPPPPPRHRRN